jgi:hypothetical protein
LLTPAGAALGGLGATLTGIAKLIESLKMPKSKNSDK